MEKTKTDGYFTKKQTPELEQIVSDVYLSGLMKSKLDSYMFVTFVKHLNKFTLICKLLRGLNL
jgi:hypothetical protein